MVTPNSPLLSEIFSLESAEDWRAVSEGYESLFLSAKTKEAAIHFAFFCWYLLWQWDEICFPGEESLSMYERPNAEIRNGISKTKLFLNLDSATEFLLDPREQTPKKYLVVLCHMKNVYPYFFRDETFPDMLLPRLLDLIAEGSFCEPGVQVIYNYIMTRDSTHLTADEKTAIDGLFPKDSLIQSYFTWLFS